jgi:hypothetical protein
MGARSDSIRLLLGSFSDTAGRGLEDLLPHCRLESDFGLSSSLLVTLLSFVFAFAFSGFDIFSHSRFGPFHLISLKTGFS